MHSQNEHYITEGDLLKHTCVVRSVPKIEGTRYDTRAWSLLGYIGPDRRYLN